MSLISDDEVVLTDDPITQRARFYRWLLDHLAKFPGRVAAVTFAGGAGVTAVVVLADGDTSLTTVVSLVATLWALFFAVMIYLLTARDTDKVLEQISDLREQLATALAAPDEEPDDEEDQEFSSGETVTEAEPGDAAGEQGEAAGGQGEAAGEHGGATGKRAGATGERAGEGERESSDAGAVPEGGVPAPSADSDQRRSPGPARGDAASDRARADHERRSWRAAESARGDRDRAHLAPGAHRPPRLLIGADAIADGVPGDLVDAWVSVTGKSRDQLVRAWSRDPRSDRQWVLETAGHQRWVVFSKGDRGVGVISLGGRGRGGGVPGRGLRSR